MKYCTDDGKHIFDTERELFDYENKVKAEKEAKAKLAEARQAREDEIKNDYEAWIKKVKKYNEDYSEPLTIKTNSPLGSTFFSPFGGIFDSLFRW